MSTTTSPAPVTPPPRLGAMSHAEELQRPEEARWAGYLRWLGDATSIVLLIAVLWWLAYHDGGLEHAAMARVGLIGLVASPALAAEFGRVPRSLRALIGLWTVGLIASLVFAAERSEFAQDTIIYALVPVVGLATHRIWRRPWGAPALAAMLLVSFGLYWRHGFLSWWGFALMEGRDPHWSVLSWHNQSGVLMVAFALLFAGVALNGRRIVASLFALCASAALAGVWLAGSRGAMVVLGLGGVIHLVVCARTRGWITAMTRIGGLALAAWVVVAGLLWFASEQSPPADSDVSRVTSVSGGPAADNFFLRFMHMRAAIGMFVDAPLTGQGVGSYHRMALPYTSPDSNLTRSAHNEYAEILGEGGLALALPFAGLTVFALIAGTRRFLRSDRGVSDLTDEIEPNDLRWPLSLGAVAAIPALLVHQGADFDWGYPIIPALLALSVAIAGLDTRGPARSRQMGSRAARAVIAAGLAMLVMVGSVGILWQERSRERQPGLSAAEVARVPVAWDIERTTAAASQLASAGEFEPAIWTLQRATTWNPGYYPLRTQLAIVRYQAGDLSSRELLDTLYGGYLHFASANRVAAALIEAGEHRLADSVLRAFTELYPRYEAWGIDGARAYSWYLVVRNAAEAGGCQGARVAATRAKAADGMAEPEATTPIEGLVNETCDPDA